MYEQNPYGPEWRRLPWTDLGEVRKAVLRCLDEDRLDVHWHHIFDGRHRVSADEIRTALEDGFYEFDEAEDDRYSATYLARRARFAIVVCFEIWESGGAREVFVLTAFHAGRFRGRGRRG